MKRTTYKIPDNRVDIVAACGARPGAFTETETMGVMDWSGVTLVVGAICLLAGAMVVIDLFRP